MPEEEKWFEKNVEELEEKDIKDIFKKANGIVVNKEGKTLIQYESDNMSSLVLTNLRKFVGDNTLQRKDLTCDKSYELFKDNINSEDFSVKVLGVQMYKGHPLNESFKKALVRLYVNDVCGNNAFQEIHTIKEQKPKNCYGKKKGLGFIDLAKERNESLKLTKEQIEQKADSILKRLQILMTSKMEFKVKPRTKEQSNTGTGHNSGSDKNVDSLNKNFGFGRSSEDQPNVQIPTRKLGWKVLDSCRKFCQRPCFSKSKTKVTADESTTEFKR